MNLLSDKTILDLHKKYAPHDTAFQIVFEHCQIISAITEQLIEQNHLVIDNRLVHVAAMLHDIGYYPLFDNSGYVPKATLIIHGVKGAEILRQEGLDEAVCRIAERHTGVGLTSESILSQNLPLPPRDLVAETSVEWLVMYADKLHTKSISPGDPHDTRGWFVSPETYLKITGKFGESNAATFRQLIAKYGVPDLQTMANKYSQELK